MTNDPFLDQLRADWNRHNADLDRVRERVKRRCHSAKRMAGLAIGGAFLMFMMGVWFVYRALVVEDAASAIGALASLIGVPLILADYFTIRRSLALRFDDTPAGFLGQARHQAETSRRLLRGHRAVALILIGCSTAMLFLFALGLVTQLTARFAGLAWGALALLVWFWQLWREQRLASEIEQCDQLLTELEEAGGDEF